MFPKKLSSNFDDYVAIDKINFSKIKDFMGNGIKKLDNNIISSKYMDNGKIFESFVYQDYSIMNELYVVDKVYTIENEDLKFIPGKLAQLIQEDFLKGEFIESYIHDVYPVLVLETKFGGSWPDDRKIKEAKKQPYVEATMMEIERQNKILILKSDLENIKMNAFNTRLYVKQLIESLNEKPINIEFQKTIETDDLKGLVDIYVETDSNIYIIDLKSTELDYNQLNKMFLKNYKRQLCFYAHILSKQTDKTIYGLDIITNLRNYQKIPIVLTPNEFTKIKNNFYKSFDFIDLVYHLDYVVDVYKSFINDNLVPEHDYYNIHRYNEHILTRFYHPTI